MDALMMNRPLPFDMLPYQLPPENLPHGRSRELGSKLDL